MDSKLFSPYGKLWEVAAPTDDIRYCSLASEILKTLVLEETVFSGSLNYRMNLPGEI